MVLIHQAFVCKADWRIGQTEVAEVWSSMNTMNWRYWAQPFHFFFGDVVTPKLMSVRWARRLPFGYRSAWVLGHVGTADLVFEVCFKWCRRRPLNACKCLQHYVKSRQGCTTWLLQFLPWNVTYCNKFPLFEYILRKWIEILTLQFATVAFVNGCTPSPFLKMVHLLMENQKSLL